MSFTLRPYQSEAVSAGVRFLKGPNLGNGIIVCPTGGGKSLIIANIVAGLGAPTIVFQPSKEILEQNYAKLRSYGYEASIYSASLNRKRISDITFATIGSVKSKADLFREFKYILVDEVHGVSSKTGMYRDFFSQLDGTRILGLTATPYRLVSDGFGGSILKFLTRTRPRIFQWVVYHVQIGQLFKDGHLARLEYESVSGFDRSKVKANSTGADYDDRSLQGYYQATGFKDRVLGTVRRLAETRRNVLVFTRFIEESEYLVNRLPNSAIVTGETPKAERERIISGFRSGAIKTVCNVGVLVCGFDYPELETVVLARPTMSLALFYQQIGRAIRPHPGKDHSLVVDLCGNVAHFGKVEDLKLENGGNGKWFVSSNGRPLTNVYFGEGQQGAALASYQQNRGATYQSYRWNPHRYSRTKERPLFNR